MSLNPGIKNDQAQEPEQVPGQNGGLARAARLTPEQRREIARVGAISRWEKAKGQSLPRAVYGAPDQPLRIGDISIPCYVLDDGRRVFTQKGLIAALGMKPGSIPGGGDRLVNFAATRALSPLVSNDLRETIENPVLFWPPSGSIARGYPATVLAELCDLVLTARERGNLERRQVHIAARCELLVRGFARVGIIALVDEATGYQRHRAERSLAEILEAFIAKELRKWVRTFPAEFYEQMFRLRGWEYPNEAEKSSRRPRLAGKLTDDVVYRRLAPGVRDELRRLTPRSDSGRFKVKLHQNLSKEIGHPRLLEHLSAVIALMRISDNWSTFMKHLNRALPRYGSTLELLLND